MGPPAAWLEPHFGDDTNQLIALYGLDDPARGEAGLVDMLGDDLFGVQHRFLSAHHADEGHPVFLYHFTRTAPNPRQTLGAFHAADVPFAFGSHDGFFFVADRGDWDLTAEMIGYWTRFAATGDPNGPGAPPWPRYHRASDEWLILDRRISTRAGVRRDKLDLLEAALVRKLDETRDRAVTAGDPTAGSDAAPRPIPDHRSQGAPPSEDASVAVPVAEDSPRRPLGRSPDPSGSDPTRGGRTVSVQKLTFVLPFAPRIRWSRNDGVVVRDLDRMGRRSRRHRPAGSRRDRSPVPGVVARSRGGHRLAAPAAPQRGPRHDLPRHRRRHPGPRLLDPGRRPAGRAGDGPDRVLLLRDRHPGAGARGRRQQQDHRVVQQRAGQPSGGRGDADPVGHLRAQRPADRDRLRPRIDPVRPGRYLGGDQHHHRASPRRPHRRGRPAVCRGEPRVPRHLRLGGGGGGTGGGRAGAAFGPGELAPIPADQPRYGLPRLLGSLRLGPRSDPRRRHPAGAPRRRPQRHAEDRGGQHLGAGLVPRVDPQQQRGQLRSDPAVRRPGRVARSIDHVQRDQHRRAVRGGGSGHLADVEPLPGPARLALRLPHRRRPVPRRLQVRARDGLLRRTEAGAAPDRRPRLDHRGQRRELRRDPQGHRARRRRSVRGHRVPGRRLQLLRPGGRSRVVGRSAPGHQPGVPDPGRLHRGEPPARGRDRARGGGPRRRQLPLRPGADQPAPRPAADPGRRPDGEVHLHPGLRRPRAVLRLQRVRQRGRDQPGQPRPGPGDRDEQRSQPEPADQAGAGQPQHVPDHPAEPVGGRGSRHRAEPGRRRDRPRPRRHRHPDPHPDRERGPQPIDGPRSVRPPTILWNVSAWSSLSVVGLPIELQGRSPASMGCPRSTCGRG